MIPPILHHIFFGDWPFNDLNKRCHATWAAVLPDFEIMHWTLATVPDAAKPPWVLEALSHPGAASGSNAGAYIKFWLLNRFGGVCLDNDMELLKPVELNHDYWCGWQRDGPEADVNMSACACVPKHPFNEAIMREILCRPVNDDPLAFGPALFTQMLRARGLTGQNVEQTVQGIKVYSKEKFYPWRWDETPDRSRIAPETFGCHHWEGTWK